MEKRDKLFYSATHTTQVKQTTIKRMIKGKN
jgi:hypothetical protein